MTLCSFSEQTPRPPGLHSLDYTKPLTHTILECARWCAVSCIQFPTGSARATCLTLWDSFSELVPESNFPKRKLTFPGHQISWMIESVSEWLSMRFFSIFLSRPPCSAMEAVTETKFDTSSLWDENDSRTLNTRIVQRKRVIPHSMMKNITCTT